MDDYQDPSEASPAAVLPRRPCPARFVHDGHPHSVRRADVVRDDVLDSPVVWAGARVACWCPGISEVVVQLPELATSGTLDGATGYIYPTQEADDVTTEQAEQYGPTPTSQGVLGYRNLTPAEIELINEIKRLERKVAAKWVEVEAGIPGTDPDDPSQTVFPDTRWLNLARDQLQHGFSDLIRSVAKPVDPYDAGGGGTV